MRIILVISLYLLTSFEIHSSYNKEFMLQSSDVRKIMEQMMDYHVNVREVTPNFVRRSLERYLEQFDSHKLYLLDSEVKQLTNIPFFQVKEIIADYYRDEFTYYQSFDSVIQQAIMRAQKWRKKLPSLIREFVETPPDLTSLEFPSQYASTVNELHARMKQDFFIYLEKQSQYVGNKQELLGREVAVIRLYENYQVTLENFYLYQDGEGNALTLDVQRHEFLLRLLKSMAKSLDTHSAFFSADEAYEMKARLEKGFSGIGIVLQETLDGVSIIRLVEGGPAEESRMIMPYDRIVEIDGKSIVEWSFDKVLDVIRGKEGEAIILGVARKAKDETLLKDGFFQVELIRRQISLKEQRVDISYDEVDEGIVGTITLHSFYDGVGGISSEKDVRDAIRELRKKGDVKGIVLDLRENSGGFLIQAVKVAGLFIDSGVVVVAKYSNGQMRYFRDIDGYSHYDGPLVVLTSRASASAAEIVAQALQDYGVALVIGDDRTYGKGSVQHQTVTDDFTSSFFKVTVGGYYTPSGKSTQIVGVRSDIQVPSIYYQEEMGEEFVSHPLHFEPILPSFKDELSDVDPKFKLWFVQHYLSSVEEPDTTWIKHLPDLREGSQIRLRKNLNFQKFLKGKYEGEEDLQMVEAINILKDMVNLQEEGDQIVEERGKNNGSIHK